MAFWAARSASTTRTGEVVSANVLRGQVSLTPDPLLTVTATLANGQLVPYPAPVLGAP